MKKRIFGTLMGIICSLVVCGNQVNATSIPLVENENVAVQSVQPRIVVSYEKTITVNYNSFSEVTETYYYQEYSDAYRTVVAGTLKLKTLNVVNGVYVAKYTGNLIGNI